MPSLTKVQPAFILAQGAIELDSGTASAPSLKFATSSSTGMFSPSTGALAFSTGSTQNALTILSGGNVGIGTTNPGAKLDVRGRTNLIAGGSGWDDGLNLYSSDATNRWNLLVDDGASDGFRVAYNNSERFRLESGGNIAFSNGTGFTYNSNTIWHAGNDGSGSGLDADLLDGLNATSANTASTIVARDSSGNFSAGTITATLSGSSSSLALTSGVINSSAWAGGTSYHGYTYSGGNYRFGFSSSSGVLDVYADGNFYATDSSHLVWHAGNAPRASSSNLMYYQGFTLDANTMELNSTGFTYSVNAPSTGPIVRFAASGYDLWLNATYNGGGTNLYFRTRNGDTTSFNSWHTIWNSANDGAGSGLDADLLDGLQLHTGTNNEANKVVRTDGNGYIQAGWINTTSGGLGVTTRLDRVYTSNDGYIRYLGLTDFKNQMGLSSKNSYSRAVDYTSNSDYWVGSFGHSGYGANETFHGGSGFFDIWGGTNYPSGFTHIHGINMLHYTTNSLGSTGGVAYGWQLTTQYDSDAGPYWRRCNAGSFSNWRKIWHDTNDGAGSGLDADLLDGNNSSYFLNTSSSSQTKSGNLRVTAISESWAEGVSVSVPSAGNWGGYRLRRERGGDDGNWAFGYTALDSTDDLVFISNNGGVQVNNILRLTKTSRVGVNNSSPLQTLDVRGNFLLAADSTTATHITQKPYTINNGTLSWEGSAGQLFSITNNLTTGSIFSVNDVSGIPSIDVDANGTIELAPFGGNVGVGTTNPTTKLHVIGDILASGNVTAYSDLQLKDNIKSIDNAIEKVLALRGVSFTRIDTEDKDKKHIGVIAQEVEQVLPEVVQEHSDGIKSVAYGNMVGLLIEAIKEQQSQIESLKGEIKSLKRN